MQFYDLFRNLLTYIPDRFSYVSGFFSELLPLLLMVCALFTAFFGLKCGSLWCGTTFFLLGSSLSAQYILPSVDFQDLGFWFALSLCVIIGVLCAYFSKYLYRVQLAVSLFFLVLTGMPPFIFHFGDLFARIVSAVVALALAFLSVKYKYLIVIVTTSFSGSFIFWNVISSNYYDVPFEFFVASFMGVAALCFQVYFNREQLKETYKDVKMKYKKTKRAGEKAVDKVEHDIDNFEVIKHYDALIDEGNDPVHDSDELRRYMDKWDGEEFVECLKLTKQKTALEIGVGTGRLALKTAPLCKELVGIDLSHKTIERAKENLKDFDNIKLVHADFYTHKFKEQFDVVYSSLTFMHMKDKQKAVDKVNRVLKENGTFVLSIDKNTDEKIDMKTRVVKVYPDDFGTINKCLKKSGFVIKKVFETENAIIIKAKKPIAAI